MQTQIQWVWTEWRHTEAFLTIFQLTLMPLVLRSRVKQGMGHILRSHRD
jgi:hypothetical protein